MQVVTSAQTPVYKVGRVRSAYLDRIGREVMEHNFERLRAHILSLSNARDWSTAKLEWEFVYAEISDEFGHCPCGQEIKEHCHLHNRRNGQTTWVGNVCVKRFVGIDTGTLFDGLKRLIADPAANANEAVIEYARKRGYLFTQLDGTEHEYRFLMNTRHKRILSAKVRAWKEKIARRILLKIQVRKRTGS